MKRILVIDDDNQIRKMLAWMLGGAGYQVETAADGRQGVAAFRANPSHLVITDLIMPEKEGIEIIIEMKRDFPQTPIIAMSGGARIGPETYLQMAQNLGAKFTFTKPIPHDALLGAVTELIGPP